MQEAATNSQAEGPDSPTRGEEHDNLQQAEGVGKAKDTSNDLPAALKETWEQTTQDSAEDGQPEKESPGFYPYGKRPVTEAEAAFE